MKSLAARISVNLLEAGTTRPIVLNVIHRVLQIANPVSSSFAVPTSYSVCIESYLQ